MPGPVGQGEELGEASESDASASPHRHRASLIHFSLGEPVDADTVSPQRAGREDEDTVEPGSVGGLPIDRVALRKQAPDIDLGERRRRPRPARTVPFLMADAPRTSDRVVRDELPTPREPVAQAERVEQAPASPIEYEGETVYQDLGEHDLSATIDPFDDTDLSGDRTAARTVPGTYGLLTRVYEQLLGVIKRIPAWFGIRDESKSR